MDKKVGIFSRNGPKDEWRRLKANGATTKDMWDFQRLYPHKEIAMFEYGNSYNSNFDQHMAKTMKRVY
jgi:hypothetical protein